MNSVTPTVVVWCDLETCESSSAAASGVLVQAVDVPVLVNRIPFGGLTLFNFDGNKPVKQFGTVAQVRW